MDQYKELLQLILPQELFEDFEVINIYVSTEKIDIFLDETGKTPKHSTNTYQFKGFTPITIIQDFPLRGREVYFHIRRRKWLELETGHIITRSINLAQAGTHLSKEFAAFLKELYRE